ncbi:MAG: hypothetical protein BJ554DRAFT_855, partial [Olpidium bornovanus]
ATSKTLYQRVPKEPAQDCITAKEQREIQNNGKKKGSHGEGFVHKATKRKDVGKGGGVGEGVASNMPVGRIRGFPVGGAEEVAGVEGATPRSVKMASVIQQYVGLRPVALSGRFGPEHGDLRHYKQQGNVLPSRSRGGHRPPGQPQEPERWAFSALGTCQ